jgi:PAS domain S-box-containing protein
MSSVKVKEVVTNDFNQQQLVLARHTAQQIENSLNLLKKGLSRLSLSPSIQYFEKVSIGNRMEITFSSIREEGLLEIKYIEFVKPLAHILDNSGYHTAKTHPADHLYLKWASDKSNIGNILISDVSSVPIEDNPDNPAFMKESDGELLTMKMVIPVWQVSVDEAHPLATGKFSGAIVFVIDVTALIKKVTKDIRSGKTGYGWVIDKNGTFLYHPEKEFIGKNAFAVRKERKPAISFSRINEIQREKMLKGEMGTSWYISGWHRGKEGEMKKLIAYAPIQLEDNPATLIWSVAIVAPISEVEGAIHDIQSRQFLMEGVVIFTMLLGGFLIISLIVIWSSSLNEEVKKKTSELIKSENQYRLLIENANDIIFTVNRDGNIMSINKAGSTFFKRPKETLTNRNIGEICFNEDSASMQFIAIDEVFNTGKNQQIIYSVIIDDNEYWLSTNFSGLLDEQKNIFAVLAIARDITHIKKMEEQMFYTEKLASVGTLAAGVAHEINNPLAIILGFTDLLLEKTPPDSELSDILKTIEKQGTNAKRVVENLLSFTRFSENKEENVNINENINSVLSVVGNTASLHKITLVKSLSETLPPVKGHAGELQQVFFNIINNAISAMKFGGTLTIVTKHTDPENSVEIKISDTGCGIRKEHRTRIFDPLFTTKKVGEGTGLGLFVSYGIISKHGGNITFDTKIEEESIDTGTTFKITLPAVKQ